MTQPPMQQPLLSVIIPCYKVEKYLDTCLESVTGQSYRNLEIILVDDGSPDRTGEICDRWAGRDPRIKVVHKQNGGLGMARNSGMEVATGEWVAFVDSDDYISPDMYSRLMGAALSTDSDIAYGGHIKELSDGSRRKVSDFPEQRVFEKEELMELSRGAFQPIEVAPKMLTMSVCMAVHRRSVCREPFYSEREVGSEDVHFQITAMLNARRVVFIPDALYTYCYHGESLSHSFLHEKFDRYKRLARIIADTYKAHGRDYRFDHYVFIIALVSIRQIMDSRLPGKEKRAYIRRVAADAFWDDAVLESRFMSLPQRVLAPLLKKHNSRGIYILGVLYSRLSRLAGKSEA